MAHLVKNLPAMQETWVRSLGWEDHLEKRKATHFSILAWRIPWTVHGVANSWTRLSDFHFLSLRYLVFTYLDIFRNKFYDPNSCISSYLEKQ